MYINPDNEKLKKQLLDMLNSQAEFSRKEIMTALKWQNGTTGASMLSRLMKNARRDGTLIASHDRGRYTRTKEFPPDYSFSHYRPLNGSQLI